MRRLNDEDRYGRQNLPAAKPCVIGKEEQTREEYPMFVMLRYEIAEREPFGNPIPVIVETVPFIPPVGAWRRTTA